MDTIFAVSSGRPPAAIAVLRISGPRAGEAGRALGGTLPAPRLAQVRALRDASGALLDRALVLWFPGPASATGEDLLELHLHGGRAIVEAVERALGALPGLRRAEPGEFTRRAMHNGRIDLAQAEGLADLLTAETERQRRAAIAAADGLLSGQVRQWMANLSIIAAQVEAAIDFEDEADVPPIEADELTRSIDGIDTEICRLLARPTTDRVSAGVRVALIGPPNAGKSSLFNALIDRDAAIVSPIAGTTRDSIEVTVRRGGELYTLIDTAGLREDGVDPIEKLGMERTLIARDASDLILWLDDEAPPSSAATTIWIWARADGVRKAIAPPSSLDVSVMRQDTVERLWAELATRASDLLDVAGDLWLSDGQHAVLEQARQHLADAQLADDILIVAEEIRRASAGLAGLLGINATESMLDALFARFCVGK